MPRWRSQIVGRIVDRIVGLLVAIAMVTGPGTARAMTTMVEPSADDIERARELYENGVSLFDEGSYEGAALAFERAYELSEDNNLLYNIALAYDRLGDFERAIEYLDRYRALAHKSERASLERRKKSLVKRLEKQRETEAEASAAATEAESEATDGDEDGAETDTDPSSGESPTPARPARDAGRFPPLAGVLTATAAVGFGLGIGFGVSSLRRSRAGRDGCTDAGEDLYCLSSSGDDLERGRTHALVADISLAVGAAATVGAIIVVALAARRAKASATAVVPVPRDRGAGLAIVRRF